MTAIRPVRYGGVTYQWRPVGGRWQLMHAGTCVIEVIPDGRYPYMYRLKFTDGSISDMVNDAVKLSLSEDAEDLAAFDERKREPNLDFEQFVKTLKRRGKL